MSDVPPRRHAPPQFGMPPRLDDSAPPHFPSRLLVKICGVRDAATAEAAATAGADYVGVVLVAASPRFVEPARAIALAAAIREAGALPVAVVRLPLAEDALAALEAFPIVQFHGDERADDLAPFAARREVWKGLAFDAAAARATLAEGVVARLVVDGPDAGSGRGFDHAAFGAMEAEVRARTLLAGGLDPTNVADAVRVARPAGVDVSSGVERARGVKDVDRIRAFIAAARGASRPSPDGS